MIFKDASVLLNNWYVKSVFACLITGLILLVMITLVKNRVDSIAQETARNTVSEFEAEWGTPYESYFNPKYFLNIRNNTDINLKEVSVEATFYQDNGKAFNEKKYLAKWDIGEKIQFPVWPHNYQKERIKGTALREDGSPVVFAVHWFLVP